jgi:hypothetical protein
VNALLRFLGKSPNPDLVNEAMANPFNLDLEIEAQCLDEQSGRII